MLRVLDYFCFFVTSRMVGRYYGWLSDATKHHGYGLIQNGSVCYDEERPKSRMDTRAMITITEISLMGVEGKVCSRILGVLLYSEQC